MTSFDEMVANWKDLKIGHQLWNEPLAQRYTAKSMASGNNKIYTPDDVLGERLQRLAALSLLVEHDPDMLWTNTTSHDKFKVVAQAVYFGLKGSPYLWSEAVRSAMRHSITDLPRHTISPKLLPEPNLWFTFETAIGMDSAIPEFPQLSVDNMIIRDAGGGVEAMMIGEMHTMDEYVPFTDPDPTKRRAFLSGSYIPYGSVYPDDFESHQAEVQSALPLLAFLNSPYIPRYRQKASRAARRDALRAGSQPAEDEVTFLILRRPEQKRRPDAPETQSREWKHQWIVSGHMRAQWYPSEQAHHVIWIAPYLKGPSDAPLLTHVAKVAR